jgi:hypothetical protein
LQAMHKRGDLRRSADPDRLATALLAAIQGGLVLSQVHRDVDPLEAALDTLLEHIASLTTKRRSEPRRLEGSEGPLRQERSEHRSKARATSCDPAPMLARSRRTRATRR